MRTIPLVNTCEATVGNILWRNLAQSGYRVFPKMRLAEVINKEAGEWLTEDEFDMLSRASLDFVVYRHRLSVFAVEFDGPYHSSGGEAERRDLIKNRLCRKADLPLLRVTATEITEQDRSTLLDFMLMRYLAFLNMPQDFFSDPDWDVVFDVRHPFPAMKTIADRIWARYGIAWKRGDFRRFKSSRYLCDIALADTSRLQCDQFHTSAFQVDVWPRSGQQVSPAFTDVVSVTIRAWIPLQPDIPDLTQYDDMSDLWIDAFRRRAEGMWFPDVPGVYPWDIAASYCQYQALRKVERWASRNGLTG